MLLSNVFAKVLNILMDHYANLVQVHVILVYLVQLIVQVVSTQAIRKLILYLNVFVKLSANILMDLFVHLVHCLVQPV